jgi:Uncharacterised nucleotidyltransferase
MGDVSKQTERRSDVGSRQLLKSAIGHLSRLEALARNHAVDTVTSTVIMAFREKGVRSILLKGPVLARWLYEDTVRPYRDTDLLISSDDVEEAEHILSTLGFEHYPLDDIPGDKPWHAHAWTLPNSSLGVDLHRTLIGARADSHKLWLVLSRETDVMRLRGVDVEVLTPGPRAFHVVLHAAQDGRRPGRSLMDLKRAIQQVPLETWEDAARVAQELLAVPAFGAGLDLLSEGNTLAARLELPADKSVDAVLRARGAHSVALGLNWFATTPGLRRKLVLLYRKLVPSVEFMRAWSPLARRSRAGLAAAYVWRSVWLLFQAGLALRALYEAKREVRHAQPRSR